MASGKRTYVNSLANVAPLTLECTPWLGVRSCPASGARSPRAPLKAAMPDPGAAERIGFKKPPVDEMRERNLAR